MLVIGEAASGKSTFARLFLVLQNFPAAAALSIVLMAAILVLVSVYVRRSGTEDLL